MTSTLKFLRSSSENRGIFTLFITFFLSLLTIGVTELPLIVSIVSVVLTFVGVRFPKRLMWTIIILDLIGSVAILVICIIMSIDEPGVYTLIMALLAILYCYSISCYANEDTRLSFGIYL